MFMHDTNRLQRQYLPRIALHVPAETRDYTSVEWPQSSPSLTRQVSRFWLLTQRWAFRMKIPNISGIKASSNETFRQELFIYLVINFFYKLQKNSTFQRHEIFEKMSKLLIPFLKRGTRLPVEPLRPRSRSISVARAALTEPGAHDTDFESDEGGDECELLFRVFCPHCHRQDQVVWQVLRVEFENFVFF